MWPTAQTSEWLAAGLGDFGPDVVVYGAPHPLARLGPRLRAETGIPYVVMVHGAEFLLPNAIPGARRFVVDPIRTADGVFAVSDFTRRAV